MTTRMGEGRRGLFVMNLRSAARRLLAKPAWSCAVVVSVALGVAANGTMLGVLQRLLLSPPPHVADPTQLVMLSAVSRVGRLEEHSSSVFSYPQFVDLQRANEVSALAAYVEVTLGFGAEAPLAPVRGAAVSASYFETLGVSPILGRLPHASGQESAFLGGVVLGYAFWRDHLQGRRDIVGATVQLSERPYTVLAVLPRGFSGLSAERVDVWVPLDAVAASLAGPNWRSDSRSAFVAVVARLKSGVPASNVAEALSQHLRTSSPAIATSGAIRGVGASPVWPRTRGSRSRQAIVASVLSLMALVVLAISLCNVVTLLCADSLRRRQEFAVRVALGMRRRGLVALLASEQSLLGAAAVLVGLLASLGMTVIFRTRLLSSVDWASSAVSPELLVLLPTAVAIAWALGVLVTVLTVSDVSPGAALRAHAHEWSPPRAIWGRLIVVLQAALSTVLLVGAGLFVMSVANVREADTGIVNPSTLLLVQPDPLGPEPAPYLVDEQFTALREYIGHLPYVATAGIAVDAPLESSVAMSVDVATGEEVPLLPTGGPYVNAVDDGALRALGVNVLAGRRIQRYDLAPEAEGVVLVNRTMARIVWGGRSPVGSCVRLTRDVACRRVIGVVGDVVRDNVIERPTMQLYVPISQRSPMMNGRVVFVRVTGDPVAARARLQREVQAVAEGGVPLRVRSMQDLVDPQARVWQLGATAFSALGGIALFTAAIGLYATVAFRLACREHDIGVRLALGASERHIWRIVALDSLIDVAMGGLIGAAVAVVMSPMLIPMLVRVSPHDPAVFAGALGALLAAGMGATALPVRRATLAAPSAMMQN